MLARSISSAPATVRSPYGSAVTAVQAVSVGRNQSFDLAIKTADGDVATLRFNQQTLSSASSRVTLSAQGRALSQQAQSSTSLDASVSVQGTLNAQESASINALVQQVSAVAEDFFAGDMNAAQLGANQLGFSDGSLKSFSLDLQSQEVRRAAAAYQSVATATDPDTARAPSSAPALSVLPALPSLAPATPAPTRSGWLQSLNALFDAIARPPPEPLQPASQAPTTSTDST